MGRITLGLLTAWLLTAAVARAQPEKSPTPGKLSPPTPSAAPASAQLSFDDGTTRPPLPPLPTTTQEPANDPPRPNRFYGGADYLLWCVRAGHTPPLVTAGPPKRRPWASRPATSSWRRAPITST
jgi:hypothetical protein